MGKEKDTKKFELNTKTLENFDKIMSTKLDEIEELKITSLDSGSKLLNIISLCANVKTIIIEGDQRINSGKILANIFHPELVESIILNNVKLPIAKVMKRFENLNMISLNSIRFCNVKDFFSGIVPEKMEIVHISNTDMTNNTTEMINKFSNIKYLKLDCVSNFKLNDLLFLTNSQKLLKFDISNLSVPINQINNLLKCKCSKNIDLSILDNNGKILEDCKLVMIDNHSTLTIPAELAELFSKEVNCFKINEINAMINHQIEDIYFLKILKKQKNRVNVIMKDFSCLTVEQTLKVKEVLNLENIKIQDEKGLKEYNIDTYIGIRDEIDDIINNVSKHVTEPEKFMEIYKFLGTEFEIVEEEANLREKTCLKQDVAKLLRNCLQCMNIKSTIIKGYDLENNQKHSWNQVKIEKRWYNVDLALDMENIKKNNAYYCLLGDKEFLDTHSPKSGKNNYCPENFNPKLVKVFFKTGLFNENLLASYLEILIEKIKQLLNLNRRTLLLPAGEEDDDEEY